MNDETVRNLFGASVNATDDEQKFGTFVAMMSATTATYNKVLLLRLITALLFRASLVASIWLFIFDPSQWVGMPIFAVLSLLAGGVQSVQTSKKGK